MKKHTIEPKKKETQTPPEEGRLERHETYLAPPPPSKGRIIGLDCHPDTFTAAVDCQVGDGAAWTKFVFQRDLWDERYRLRREPLDDDGNPVPHGTVGEVRVSGDTLIERMNEAFSVELSHDDVDTIGGLVAHECILDLRHFKDTGLGDHDDRPAASPHVTDDSLSIRSFSDAGLNAKFNFDSFVVGSNSSYSAAVARAVAEKPGRIYNPLFLDRKSVV